MAYYDVFGTEIQEGDYILSSAKTGVTKVGYAYYSPRGNLLMKVVRQFVYGRDDRDHAPSSVAGVNVVVLKTKDGVIPGPVQNLW